MGDRRSKYLNYLGNKELLSKLKNKGGKKSKSVLLVDLSINAILICFLIVSIFL